MKNMKEYREQFEGILLELGLTEHEVEKQIISKSEVAEDKERFNLVAAVWGQEYTNFFLETALPCMLSQKNLPYLNEHAAVSLDIFTSRNDALTIKSSPIYQAVKELCPVRFFEFDNQAISNAQNNYTLMSLCHSLAIMVGKQEAAALVFLIVDSVISDGSLELIYNKIHGGYKAVLWNCVRLSEDTAVEDYHKRFGSDLHTTVDPIELARFALKHLHIQTTSTAWDGDRSCKVSCGLIWTVPDEGILLKTFQWHPIAVRSEVISPEISTAIDSSCFSNTSMTIDDIYLICDSTEGMYCEFSHPRFGTGGIGEPGCLTLEGIAQWAEVYAKPLQGEMFKFTSTIYCSKESKLWEEKLIEAEQVTESVLTMVGFQD